MHDTLQLVVAVLRLPELEKAHPTHFTLLHSFPTPHSLLHVIAALVAPLLLINDCVLSPDRAFHSCLLLLQDLQLCQPPVPANSAAAGLTNKQLQQHYAQLYDRLLEYGFQQQQVQVALAALPKGAADVAACLDWLCYNLPAQQLPRRFRGGSRLAAGAEGVKVQLGFGFEGFSG
jgi:hypothetical protein